MYLENIFSLSAAYLSIFMKLSFEMQHFLILIYQISFYSLYFLCIIYEIFIQSRSEIFLYCFFQKIYSFMFFLTSLLEYNCFTMVCQFLLYNKVNQLYIYSFMFYIQVIIYFYFIYLFIFGHVGYQLRHTGSLLRHVGSFSLWRAACLGFSLAVACRFFSSSCGAQGSRAHGLCSCGVWALLLRCASSIVVVRGLSCPVACGILVSQPGVELHPLHWKADSLPLDHQGSPYFYLIFVDIVIKVIYY